jgi:hypothetical protein
MLARENRAAIVQLLDFAEYDRASAGYKEERRAGASCRSAKVGLD